MRRGDEVKIAGEEHGRARLVAINDKAVVVAFAGWSYNPGSPHSGLSNYCSAETIVYVQDNGEDTRGTSALYVNGVRVPGRWRPLVEWKNREGSK